MTIFDRPKEEKPKMKEFTLTTQEKKEIRDRMTKTASTTTKTVFVDLIYSSLAYINEQAEDLISKYTHLTKETIEVVREEDYDGDMSYHFEFRAPRSPEELQELIEQEEKRVLRKKKTDYEQYVKLKGQFE